jgi:ubiquitin carboxyl-terminal hydrolase 25/28
VPTGLKNIGNTCYFNSILQVYYNLPQFVKPVFEFTDEGPPLEPLEALKEQQEHRQTVQRLEKSRQLILNLKKLFGEMALGAKKYADPSEVLRTITDGDGKPIELGDQ